MGNPYRGHSIDASHYNSVHLTMRFRGDDFLEINQSETKFACAAHI
jgi:hypothetical protein